MASLRIIPARAEDLGPYIDLLEEVADWLASRGIRQWRPGGFHLSRDYYATSIERGEVQLAFLGETLVGTLRLLLHEPIVWPEVTADDAVYVYNLAVRRQWANQQLGGRLLTWADHRAAALGRQYVRLDCMADNVVLRRYYAQAGFVDRGEIDARFPTPVGTLRLRRYERPIGTTGSGPFAEAPRHPALAKPVEGLTERDRAREQPDESDRRFYGGGKP